MSEFKFACPVCGQHITADRSAAGTRVECPTCFRKIVVPQAPASPDSKFILSAAEADKPRPIPSGMATRTHPVASASRRTTVSLIAVVTVLLLAGAAVYVFKDTLFRPQAALPEDSGPGAPGGGGGATTAAGPTNQVRWRLDLSGVAIPDTPASGRLRGRDFVCTRATLQGGTLTLRQGRPVPPLLGVSLYLSRGTVDFRNDSLTVLTNTTGAPRVMLRWREGEEAVTRSFSSGYALRLEFGQPSGNQLPARLYLCLPDEEQSCVAGTFVAEIKAPSPPRPAGAKR